MDGKSPRERLLSAFDELRFGPRGTLNLREGLPSAKDATARAEAWLREHQVRGTKEALIVTGRGNQSVDGVGVVRGAVERLLFSLRRRGVIASHQEHNPGAFAVQLAPIRALVDAPARRRERGAPPPAEGGVIPGVSPMAETLLRELAECSLSALGVKADASNVVDEMHRHLRAIVPGLPGGAQMDDRLCDALRAAIAEYD
ncbi:MAG: hypothetical protein WD801_13330 [Gemmatimonadaceae bacterium]